MADNTLTINGKEYSFEKDETILDIALRNKIFIPTLCHLKDSNPTGACRVCLVEIEGARNLTPACAMPASNKMKVHTDSPKVIEARRFVISLLMVSGNHNCAVRGATEGDWTDFQLKVKDYDSSEEICDAYGSCELQELAYRYQVSDIIKNLRLEGLKPKYEMEEVNPFILRDFSRCILCGRCVKACNEVQVNNAISIGYRGVEAKIVTRGDNSLKDSDCVFCGECLQVCPVGALVLKENKHNTKHWEMQKTQTICTYCGTGCSIDIFTKDGEIVQVNGTEESIVNNGSLCIKGRFGNDFVHSEERLKKPLKKEGSEFKEIEWDEAFDFIAKKLNEIKEKNGPDSIAGLSSARCTNEDNYIMQKFIRGVIGTNNIDHCARL